MKTFVKTARILSFSGAAALSLMAVAPVHAEDQTIIVESQEAMAEWQSDVTRSLNNRLLAEGSTPRRDLESGIVQFRFNVDANGDAQNIELLSGTGDRATDRAAQRAVSRVAHLEDAPVADVQSRTFQANIIFAKDHDEYNDLKAKLAKRERVRLASADIEREVILFGG